MFLLINLEKWNLNQNGTLNLKGKTLLNFLEFNNNIKFEGKLELLTEFKFIKNVEITDARYVIYVGSEITENINGKYWRSSGFKCQF